MQIWNKYKSLIFHIAWWIFYIGNFFIAQYVRNPNYEWYVIDMGLYFLSDILFFYFFINITANYLFNRKTIWMGIWFYLLNSSILYGTEASRVIWAYFAGFYDQVPKYYFQLHTLILAYLRDVVQFTGYGTMYWFYNRFYEQQKEKYQIEIGFLRGQIHDHFVYNMLNLFHDKAEVYSEELAEGILTLSDLMRYSVTECPDGLVALEKEVECVRSLIALNQQRFGETIQVTFSVEGQIDDWQVPHLSILTLVENVFKHGSLKASPLEFDLKVSAQRLDFTTKNASKPTQASASTGIGTKNLERRLNLIIPGRARLTSLEDNHFFHTHLTITR